MSSFFSSKILLTLTIIGNHLTIPELSNVNISTDEESRSCGGGGGLGDV